MSDRWQYKVEEIKGSVWGTIKPADVEERLRVLGAQGPPTGRIYLQTDEPELQELSQGVNQLIARAAQLGERGVDVYELDERTRVLAGGLRTGHGDE